MVKPKANKQRRGALSPSPATPISLYKRALSQLYQQCTGDVLLREAHALISCIRQLQQQLGCADGTAAAAAGSCSADSAASAANQHSAGAASGEELTLVSSTAEAPVGPPAMCSVAATAAVAAAAAALGGTAAAYPPGGGVTHSFDLDLEDDPSFLLAAAHMELGKLLLKLQRLDPTPGRAHLEAALRLFPSYVAGNVALAQLFKGRADSPADLDRAEALLRTALDSAAAVEEAEGGLLPEANAACRKAVEVGVEARAALAMLLCQAGRDDEAASHLQALGYTMRLSPQVLHYPLEAPSPSAAATAAAAGTPEEAGAAGTSTTAKPDGHADAAGGERDGRLPGAPCSSSSSSSLSGDRQHYQVAVTVAAVGGGPAAHAAYVRAVDDAVPVALLQHLQAAFAPGSRFWEEHGYGRVGYFSYMHALSDPPATSLHQLVQVLHAIAVQLFPAAAEARYAEWWAHCRLHPSGHQLHFDSDDEGQGGIRNPIISTVLYLTGGVGGPTLVTPQTLGGPLATHGWLLHPRQNRLGIFDGSFLHGVIPGRGPSPAPGEHRVTLMVAFWRDIQCRPRDDGRPGPSQPFPDRTTSCYSWMDLLQPHPAGVQGWGSSSPSEMTPISLSEVWAPLRRTQACGGGGSPAAVPYNECFQGF